VTDSIKNVEAEQQWLPSLINVYFLQNVIGSRVKCVAIGHTACSGCKAEVCYLANFVYGRSVVRPQPRFQNGSGDDE